jgi:hypothetical protein
VSDSFHLSIFHPKAAPFVPSGPPDESESSAITPKDSATPTAYVHRELSATRHDPEAGRAQPVYFSSRMIAAPLDKTIQNEPIETDIPSRYSGA